MSYYIGNTEQHNEISKNGDQDNSRCHLFLLNLMVITLHIINKDDVAL